MAGVSPAIQTWSINTSIMQLRSMMGQMTITDDHIRRYVVSPDEGRRMEEERNRRQNASESATTTRQPAPLAQPPPAPPAPPPTASEESQASENVVHVTASNGPTVEVRPEQQYCISSIVAVRRV